MSYKVPESLYEPLSLLSLLCLISAVQHTASSQYVNVAMSAACAPAAPPLRPRSAASSIRAYVAAAWSNESARSDSVTWLFRSPKSASMPASSAGSGSR
eukprot:scaffold17679_cov98-Isochrysis_galbana.AAC.3